jgi:uncharacterized protein (TIGR00730 family)
MKDNQAQLNAAAFKLPALDSDFILRDSMRGLRFQLEYAKAEELLRAWGVRSTVVVFGSARVRPDGGIGAAGPDQSPPRSDVSRSSSRRARWYDEARRFARIVSERGGALAPADGVRDNVIATGGGPGIMEAANRGAHDAGAPSIGFNIALPQEQEPNAYSTPELTFQFHYFAMRKMHFAMRAAALVAFPGGFGTFDELFEILNLVETRKMPKVPVICFDSTYWKQAVNFDLLAEEGMISPDELDLFSFCDDAEAAWELLAAHALGLPSSQPHTMLDR